MDAILDVIKSEPSYGLLAGILVLLLVVTVVRQLLWIAFGIVLAMALFGVHLHQLSTVVKEKVQNVGENLQDALKKR